MKQYSVNGFVDESMNEERYIITEWGHPNIIRHYLSIKESTDFLCYVVGVEIATILQDFMTSIPKSIPFALSAFSECHVEFSINDLFDRFYFSRSIKDRATFDVVRHDMAKVISDLISSYVYGKLIGTQRSKE